MEVLRERFLATKDSDGELNPTYVQNLKAFTQLFEREFGARVAGDVTIDEFRRFLDGLLRNRRHRNNIRDAIVAMYRFGRLEKLLPNAPSAIEGVARLKIRRSPEISIYSPQEFRKWLDECRPQFLPAEVIGAFAGIRQEEIRPKPNTRKDPLRWEDFNLADSYINVRDETSKTGIGRHVPLLPVLRAWLQPWMNASGPVMRHGSDWERKRISQRTKVPRLHNARRHSFGTYRMAIIRNIHQLAEEMGNSIYICRSRYVRPRALIDAELWFNLLPEILSMNVVRFEESPKSSNKSVSTGRKIASD